MIRTLTSHASTQPPAASSVAPSHKLPVRSFAAELTDWERSGKGFENRAGACRQIYGAWMNDGKALDLKEFPSLESLPDCLVRLTRLEQLHLEKKLLLKLKSFPQLPPSCLIHLDGKPMPMEQISALQARADARHDTCLPQPAMSRSTAMRHGTGIHASSRGIRAQVLQSASRERNARKLSGMHTNVAQTEAKQALPIELQDNLRRIEQEVDLDLLRMVVALDDSSDEDQRLSDLPKKISLSRHEEETGKLHDRIRQQDSRIQQLEREVEQQQQQHQKLIQQQAQQLEERDARIEELQRQLAQFQGSPTRHLSPQQAGIQAREDKETTLAGPLASHSGSTVAQEADGKAEAARHRPSWKARFARKCRSLGESVKNAIGLSKGRKEKSTHDSAKTTPQQHAGAEISPAQPRSGMAQPASVASHDAGIEHKAHDLHHFTPSTLQLREIHAALNSSGSGFRKIAISGARSKCWMRAAWVSAMIQYRDKPEQLEMCLRELLPPARWGEIPANFADTVRDTVAQLQTGLLQKTSAFAWDEAFESALQGLTQRLVHKGIEEEVAARADLDDSVKDALLAKEISVADKAIFTTEFGEDFHVDHLLRQLSAANVIFHHPGNQADQWHMQARSSSLAGRNRFNTIMESERPQMRRQAFLNSIRDIPVISHRGAHFDVFVPRAALGK